MIAAFARMTRAQARLLRVDETPQGVTLQTSRGEASGSDAPPERFVQTVEDEGGQVHVSAMVDALRAWLARQRNTSTNATKTTTPPPPTEGA